MDGELGHFQGHTDDGVPNEDLADDAQGAASYALDNLAHLVAAGGFDGQDFIWVSLHGCSEKVKCEVQALDEAVGVDTGEEAGQVLVVDKWGCLIWRSWMSSKTSPLAKL